MILTCQSCSTRYMADSVTFQPNGRMVRCSNCEHSWFQDPPDEFSLKVLPNPNSLDLGEPSEAVTLSAENTRKALAFGHLTGWVLLVGAMLSLTIGMTLFRSEIVQLWPQSATLYTSLGLEVNTRGLNFERTTYIYQNESGTPVLAVKGYVVNTSDELQILPDIRVSLRDSEKREIFEWVFPTEIKELAPNGEAEFVTHLDSPPAGAEDLVIGFATDIGS